MLGYLGTIWWWPSVWSRLCWRPPGDFRPAVILRRNMPPAHCIAVCHDNTAAAGQKWTAYRTPSVANLGKVQRLIPASYSKQRPIWRSNLSRCNRADDCWDLVAESLEPCCKRFNKVWRETISIYCQRQINIKIYFDCCCNRLWAGVHKPFPRRSKFQDQ